MKATDELYIDHEVRMRVVETAVANIETKINLLIGVLIGSVILPVVLHSFHLM